MELIRDTIFVLWSMATSPVALFLLAVAGLVLCALVVIDCLDRGREVR